MKKNLALIFLSLVLGGCSSNLKYEKNLLTAKKLFELHGQEDFEGQKKLISKEIKSVLPIYGSEPVGYESYIQMLKGYQELFDNIKYTAEVWLPGTDRNGKLDGSVRTYGNWTAVHSITGKELDLNGYWYFNFDDKGLIVEQGDFFDVGGMINAVYDINEYDELINIAQLSVKNKSKEEIDDFCEYYQKRINELEPDVFCWKFFRSGKNKITLIERYKNEAAALNHIKNISPGGLMEKDFGPFVDNFQIDYLTYYGDPSKQFKEVLKGFGIKTYYFNSISGFSN